MSFWSWLRTIFGGEVAEVRRDLHREEPSAHGVPSRRVPEPERVSASWFQIPTLELGDGQEVKGEASYQQALEQIAEDLPMDGRLVVTAKLFREPGNRYDSNSVRVEVQGKCVGYLPREDAPRFHAVIQALAAEGRPATCRGRLVGGGPDKYWGIWLDVRPERWSGLAPVLPSGNEVAVIGEEQVQNELRLLEGKDPTVELRVNEQRVEVTFEGQQLGVLTDATSAHYVDLVRACVAARIPPTCRATVTRGKRKLELVLHVARPDWLPPYKAAG